MTSSSDISFLDEFRRNTRDHLLQLRGPHGHWEGELSSSALSTATAIIALEGFANADSACDKAGLQNLVNRGLAWLANTQNADGGWGDTILSHSNISTTSLVWAAFSGHEHSHGPAVERCESWLKNRAGSLEPLVLSKAIADCYGSDRTFSVPILTTLALRNRLGSHAQAWKLVPQLPFELAAFPHKWYARLKLPVVSYALPALIAIGQVRHVHRPTRNPLTRAARKLLRRKTLRVLEEIQPSSGGFLEATPLTSFVVLSLVGAGLHDFQVSRAGVDFLIRSVRPDGSWPIDTDLATWVTTLSINALGLADSSMSDAGHSEALRWLTDQQYRDEHPYTHAAPGAWAWTDLPGGVPDADDTSGALLALHLLSGPGSLTAAQAGIRWLLDLQNRDGGIPTFCKGWGLLPFDRSSADITAHALRAWSCWYEHLPVDLQNRVISGARRALHFLKGQQNADGSWAPLWFGNQHLQAEQNLVYGTSRVLLALTTSSGLGESVSHSRPDSGAALDWLLNAQSSDGGWGGAADTPCSIEETALALEALAAAANTERASRQMDSETRRKLPIALQRGFLWLADATKLGREFPPTPIGFYFARLWYYEKLYPVIFTMAALSAARPSFRESGTVAGFNTHS
jgi:squalene-hopene/tetraprenyl-beta-curcumene cyclase